MKKCFQILFNCIIFTVIDANYSHTRKLLRLIHVNRIELCAWCTSRFVGVYSPYILKPSYRNNIGLLSRTKRRLCFVHLLGYMSDANKEDQRGWHQPVKGKGRSEKYDNDDNSDGDDEDKDDNEIILIIRSVCYQSTLGGRRPKRYCQSTNQKPGYMWPRFFGAKTCDVRPAARWRWLTRSRYITVFPRHLSSTSRVRMPVIVYMPRKPCRTI